MTRDERRAIVWAAAKKFGYRSPQHNRAIQKHMVPNEHGVFVYKHDEPKTYIVQTFRGATSEANEFSSLEYARKHVGLNPCSLIFRKEQVSRIENGWVSLKDGDSTPLDCEVLAWAATS
jgi:hypothetical protein